MAVRSNEATFTSVADQLLDRFKASPLVRQVEWFKDVGEGRVPAAHPLHRGLEVQKAVVLQGGETAEIRRI